MMKLPAAYFTSWSLGIAVAFAGVALVRLVAPVVGPTGRICAAVAGFALAALGLFLIARGVNRRLARAHEGAPGEARDSR